MHCQSSQFHHRSLGIPVRLSAVCWLVLIVMSLGCERDAAPDYESLGLAEVSGIVRLDAKPLADANVIFESEDETFSYGTTNSDGKYSLMFNSEKSGVLTGEKVVRIQLGRIAEDGEIKSPASGLAELPESYHQESQLRATVNSGVQTIDFELNSDGSTTSPTNM
ncbi:carboxypeptidase-like regulatory domain-containing protein [bacterium]|nr:carboxypeptidase-like regulatory domain-containing protein [bacterium]